MTDIALTDVAIMQTWFSYPAIDPIAFQIGPFILRWYALAYMAGLIGGWQILRRLSKNPKSPVSATQLDQLLNAVLFGVIVGGRLGYVIFYKPLDYLSDPLAIVRIWEGGMSFHGGFIGVIIATYLFARKHHIALWRLSDMVALVAPLGLFFGRIANFINGELYGRVTSHPVGMVFPTGGPEARHPSQLYEAGLEGIILGTVFALLWRFGMAQRYPGLLVALFLIGYGMARFIVEFAREPDSHIGLYDLGFISLSHGQLLCLPMILIGTIFGYRVTRPGAS